MIWSGYSRGRFPAAIVTRTFPFLAARPATTALVASALLLAPACSGGGEPSPASETTRRPTIHAMARALGRDAVERLVRGYVPGRSGEIQIVPEPWNVLGQWNGGVRGARDPRTTHPTPWSYHQRVPIVLYGPGSVRDGLISDRSVDVADLAPTFAQLLGMPFDAPGGSPLRDSLTPGARRPAAIVVVVQDGGGWNALERWPQAWPELRRLASSGTAYVNATAGSAPSITAPVHATIGTGAYPRGHGIPENTVRLPGGEVADAFGGDEGDPSLLRLPTFADAWERRMAGEPWVGLVGYETWHLPMMGTGSPGGDRDVVMLWDRHAGGLGRLWAPADRYRLPASAPGTDLLERRLRGLDRADGAADGRWRGVDLANTYEVPGTPAFASFAGDAVVRVVRRAPIGDDRVTDLLFVEQKTIDYGGHLWNMESPSEGDVIRAADRALARLVDALDREVGRGRYVLAVTADHGQTPNPATTGGLRVDRYALAADVEARFGAGIVTEVHPSQLFLDREAARAAGVRVWDVARFIGDYRYGDGIPAGTDVEGLPASVLNRRVFAAAIPGPFLAGLSPDEIDRLGPGSYPEGDLSTPPQRPRELLTD